MLKIKFKKEDSRAIIPEVAYNGTSACFDLYAIEDTIIPARGFAFIANGLKVMWNDPSYYLMFQNRSGNGIKMDLFCHQGIIDYGYTGDLTIKMYNLGDQERIIKKGKGIVQVQVVKKHPFIIEEANEEEWKEYEKNSLRKKNGFGSSDNKK